MRFTLILLYIAIAISTLSYIPNIYLNIPLYGILRMSLYTIMISEIALTFSFSKVINNGLLRNSIIIIAVLIILFLCFYAIGLNYRSSDITQSITPLSCIIIGYCGNFSNKDINRLTIFYIILSVIVAALSASTYSAIMDIGEYSYLLEGKNQIGAIVAVAISLAVYLIPLQTNKYYKVSLIASLFIGIFASYIIGCRSAFLSFILFTFFVFVKRNLNNLFKYTMIACIAIFVIYFFWEEQITSIFENFFVGDKNANDLDDISSGRMDRNIAAINYILDNFFSGELIYYSHIPLIHNYILLKWVRYGVFAIPFLCFYLMIIINAASKVINNKQLLHAQMGFYIIIIPYIISMLEPGAPFGPGSVYFFTYLIYGFSLNRINN